MTDASKQHPYYFSAGSLRLALRCGDRFRDSLLDESLCRPYEHLLPHTPGMLLECFATMWFFATETN
jgi:hypothetical protein